MLNESARASWKSTFPLSEAFFARSHFFAALKILIYLSVKNYRYLPNKVRKNAAFSLAEIFKLLHEKKKVSLDVFGCLMYRNVFFKFYSYKKTRVNLFTFVFPD